MNSRVTVSRPGSEVEAWSSVRLPFEPTGALADFRRDLQSACRTLVAQSDALLHAVYSSADRSRVDVENVLMYNLGTGAIRAAARNGILLERVFEQVGHEYQHHYRYQLVDRQAEWSRWDVGAVVASLRVDGAGHLFSSPKAGRWWLAARRGKVVAHRRSTTVPDRFGLVITVTPPATWRGSLAGLLKPLADGLVAAVHAYGPAVDPIILGRAAMIDPSLTFDTLHDLLVEPDTAPLGRWRFITAYRDGVMVSPADDRMVALDARIDRHRQPGTVTADFVDVRPSATA